MENHKNIDWPALIEEYEVYYGQGAFYANSEEDGRISVIFSNLLKGIKPQDQEKP